MAVDCSVPMPARMTTAAPSAAAHGLNGYTKKVSLLIAAAIMKKLKVAPWTVHLSIALSASTYNVASRSFQHLLGHLPIK